MDWTRVRESIRLHLIERGKIEDPDAEVAEPEMTIIQNGDLIDFAGLPRDGVALAKRMQAKGLIIQALHSRTHSSAVLYMTDSSEKSKKQYRRGDVRFSAEDRDHYEMRATIHHGEVALGYRFIWDKREGKSNSFQGGWSRDTVTGTFFSSTLSDFDDELDMRFPLPEPRKPKKPKDTRTKDEKLLDGEDWVA